MTVDGCGDALIQAGLSAQKGTIMKKGWWSLIIAGVDELTETDQEHIAELIKQGFTSGEIVQEDEEE